MEWFCPSEIVYDLLQKYKVKAEKRIIWQGIDLAKFVWTGNHLIETAALRENMKSQKMNAFIEPVAGFLWKNIQAVIGGPSRRPQGQSKS